MCVAANASQRSAMATGGDTPTRVARPPRGGNPAALPARDVPGRTRAVYFVTSKRPGYALFSMTPSERAAIAVTDDQKRVHLLERVGSEWRVCRDWPVEEHSHTELMTRLALVDEPASIEEIARLGAGA